MKMRRTPALETAAGFAVCLLAATVAVIVLRDQSWRASVPLVFIAVVAVVALLVNPRGAGLGGVVAAILFALFLFRPFGSFRMENDEARGNLLWLVLASFVVSRLFAPGEVEGGDAAGGKKSAH